MEGRVPFAWSAGPEAVVIIGTELPAGLGQDGVRPRKRIRCGGLPAVALSVCLQYVCSLSAVCLQFVSVAGESRVTAVGCWWGSRLGCWLCLGLGSWAFGRWIDCSTVHYSTVLYCMRAYVHA
jgi:hypothetical protein